VAVTVSITAKELVRSTRKITFDGETLTLSEWATATGLGRATGAYRLNNGWDTESALNRAPHSGKPLRKAGL